MHRHGGYLTKDLVQFCLRDVRSFRGSQSRVTESAAVITRDQIMQVNG